MMARARQTTRCRVCSWLRSGTEGYGGPWYPVELADTMLAMAVGMMARIPNPEETWRAWVQRR